VNWLQENTEAAKTTRMLRHTSRCVNATSPSHRMDDAPDMKDIQYLKGISVSDSRGG
jgi:hypothetical protein